MLSTAPDPWGRRNGRHDATRTSLDGDAGATGHDHYGSLQFSGDDVVNVLSTSGEGIDSPNGVVISFYVWIDAVETLGNGRWLSLLLLSGACDWSDSVFSLAIEDSSGRLAVGPVEPSSEYAPGAPAVASENWTRVTAYVNYYEQVFHVWQDGQPVVSVDFERPGQRLCHIMMGTMASENNDDLLVKRVCGGSRSHWRICQLNRARRESLAFTVDEQSRSPGAPFRTGRAA